MEKQNLNGSLQDIAYTVHLEVERDVLQNQAALLRTRNARLVEHSRDLEAMVARLARLLLTLDAAALPVPERADERFTAGRCLAPVWRNEAPTGHPFTEFGLYRETTFGDAVARFRPEDVLDMPRLIQQLAAHFAKQESLDAELRDDLSCLACCLDDFLGQRRCPHQLKRPERAALTAIIDYLWEGEERNFLEHPSKDHVFNSLKVLKEWFSASSDAAGQSVS
jgi:hypothetical protein